MATAQEAPSDAKAQSTVAKQLQLLDDDALVQFFATQDGGQWAEIMNAVFGGSDNSLKNKVIGAGEKALNSLGDKAQAIADKVNANVPAINVVKENDLWKIKAKGDQAAVAGKEVENSKTTDEIGGIGSALQDIGNDIEQNSETERTISGPATKK
ncbi:MAG: hypothetical protein IJJ26_05010 [Victivallales bacterium]|nr:hypothetical protein [Victivallales bacterium]